jgi:hypothetical protein
VVGGKFAAALFVAYFVELPFEFFFKALKCLVVDLVVVSAGVWFIGW